MKRVIMVFLCCFFILICTACRQADQITPEPAVLNLQDLPLMTKNTLICHDLDPVSFESSNTGVFFATPGDGDFGFASTLYYFDNVAGQIVPVCNEANCTHDSRSPQCHANLTGMEAWRGMWLNDNNLYVVGGGTGKYAEQCCLWKIATNGSGAEIMVPLGRMTNDGTYLSGNWVIQNRTLYYAKYNDSNSITLYAQALDGGKAESLYTVTGIGCQLLRICAVNNGLYFEEFYYTDDSLAQFEGRLIYYDLESHQETTVIENCFKPYAIGFDGIYYVTSDSVSFYSPKEGRSKEICKIPSWGNICFDGQHLILTLDDEEELLILSTDGNVLHTIPYSDKNHIRTSFYLSDPEYIASVAMTTEGKTYLSLLNKATSTWQDVSISEK